MTIEFWYLIGAALVFFMQAGFAMVENVVKVRTGEEGYDALQDVE